MPTLLLRLAGPMQSWGTQSRFSVRDTGLEPSKSGVIGLVCAALGKPRAEAAEDKDRWPSLDALRCLRMGVRVDREGTVREDFHTAGGSHRRGSTYGVAKANSEAPDPVTSHRYYLADAAFLVGLQGDDVGLLDRLHSALAAPGWPLCLGRKAFVPGVPPYLPDGLVDRPLLDALAGYPWLARSTQEAEEMRRAAADAAAAGRPIGLRTVVEAEPFGPAAAESGSMESGEVRRDVPLSFEHRSYTVRRVQTIWTPLTPQLVEEDALCISRA